MVGATPAPGRAIASTAYDTAWVAAVPHPADRRNPRFPSALGWIAARQHPDGSWGSPIKYYHDRIVCTLAALIPLAKFGRRDIDREQVRRGERFLWQHAHLLRADPCELVGFELLLSPLIGLAAEAGVQVPPHLDTYSSKRAEKLALLPPQLIYSPNVTLVHSLEFLGSEVNPLQLLATRSPNGSIGNSPAATAFLLHHVEDQAAVAYLTDCLSGDGGAAVPVLEPCETFEALWIAYHQFLAGTPASQLFGRELEASLVTALSQHGVSLSPSFPIPDADDTAVALVLLHEAGVRIEPSALLQFERDNHFVSFPYERHASTGVNIHVLQALLRYPQYPQRQASIAKILEFLRAVRYLDSYWFDKWHISPYYATSHAIVALSELPPFEWPAATPLITAAVEWMLHTQNQDGSWGFYGVPTAEETAYCVLAMRRLGVGWSGLAEPIERARAYLTQHADDPRPSMWIDKCLYHPRRIVAATINGALGCSAAG